MTTVETTVFWDSQQEVVAEFSRLLKSDFTEADRLIQSDENFDHVLTFNACHTLYQQHCAEKREADRETSITLNQMHV